MFSYAVYVIGNITKCPNCSRRLKTHATPKYKMFYCEFCRRRYVMIDVYRRYKRDFRCLNPEALQKLIKDDMRKMLSAVIRDDVLSWPYLLTHHLQISFI